MKGKKHSPDQIIRRLAGRDQMLNEGKSVQEVVRQFQISENTWYRLKNQYGGMKAQDAKELKLLRDENRKLKVIVADQALDIVMLKELAEGNF